MILTCVFMKLVSTIVDYAGKSKRGSDLFGTQNPLSFTKKFLKGLKVEAFVLSEFVCFGICCAH